MIEDIEYRISSFLGMERSRAFDNAVLHDHHGTPVSHAAYTQQQLELYAQQQAAQSAVRRMSPQDSVAYQPGKRKEPVIVAYISE